MHFELLENRTLLAIEGVDEPAGEEQEAMIVREPIFVVEDAVARLISSESISLDAVNIIIEGVASILFGAGVTLITISAVNSVRNYYNNHQVPEIECSSVGALLSTGLFGIFTAVPLVTTYAPWNDSETLGEKIVVWGVGAFGFVTGITCISLFLYTGNARQTQQLGTAV